MRTDYVAVDVERLASLRRVCRAADGPSSLAGILGIFLDLSIHRLRDLQEALTAGDSDRLSSVAHAMQGGSGLFGAAGLSAAAREVEEAAERGALAEVAFILPRLDAELARVVEVLAQEIYDCRYRSGSEEPGGVFPQHAP
jgi:HPt (histidine-containing phosphotransfer) domain-containing protein